MWRDTDDVQVLLCQTSGTNMATRQDELREKLQYDEDLTAVHKKNLEQVLLSHFDVFALTDEELETDLGHHIDIGDTTPVKALHCRLPHAVQKELERKIDL